MTAASVMSAIAVAPLPINQVWLRPGALARLHDPAPAWVTGLPSDFLAGRYGRPFATIAKEKLQ